MSSFRDKPKFCCLRCKKEFFSGMYDLHLRSCDKKLKKEEEKFKNKIVFEDYVICGICKKKLLENNQDHLAIHKTDKFQYDKSYPDYPRISKNGLIGKNNFKNGPTEEQSKRLKHSHTLESYIEKLGEIEGEKRYKEIQERKNYSKTIEYYISVYGIEEGSKIYSEIQGKKKLSLKNFIERYGQELGNQKYEDFCTKKGYQNTLNYYIKKHGEELGFLLWKEKYNKISLRNSRNNKVEYSNKAEEYYYLVERLTRIEYNKFINEIDPNLIRSREFHLDHKVSRSYGFINKIHPVYISSKYNLEMQTRSYNCSKQHRIDYDPVLLKEKVDNDEYYKRFFKEFPFEFRS